MTIEELLKPRYKAISDYPNSPYQLGQMVYISDTGNSFLCTQTNEYNRFSEEFEDVSNYSHIDTIKRYPHLFKPLNWWEERRAEEMPLYVKAKLGKVVKVAGFGNVGQNGEGEFHIGWQDLKKGLQTRPARTFTPATEEEYLAQNTNH
jgi:hypothetical protein